MKRFKYILLVLVLVLPMSMMAKSAAAINSEVNLALNDFYSEVIGGKNFLDKTKGYLVFPEVVKAGFGIGGEYGEGALIVNKRIVAYYNTVSASVGLQFGVQKKSIIIAFLTNSALRKFRNSKGFKVGVDGSVAIAKWGAGKDISNLTVKEPIVAFVFGNKGLMYNITIEGNKISRIHPK